EGVAGMVLLAALLLHLGVFTSIKTMLTDIQPFFADRMLADLDEAIHGQAPWRYTLDAFSPATTRLMGHFYFGCWGLCFVVCPVACVFLRHLRAVRDQYLWTHLLLWPLLGNLVAVAFMSGGPLFYDQVVHD